MILTSCASPSGAYSSSPMTSSNGSASLPERSAGGSSSAAAPRPARCAVDRTPGPYDVSQRELALCLSLPAAVLSHASAAGYWGIRRALKDRVELTVPHGARVDDHRAVVHYSNRLPGSPRRGAGGRRSGHIGGPDGVRPRWRARRAEPPVGDRGRPQQAVCARTPSSARCTTTCAVGAAAGRRRGSGSRCSPSGLRVRRCRSWSSSSSRRCVAAGLPRGDPAAPGDAAERPHGVPRPRVPRCPRSTSRSTTPSGTPPPSAVE